MRLDDHDYSIRSICVCTHARDLHQLGYACKGKAWNFLDERAEEGPCDCLEYIWDEGAWQADEEGHTGVVT